MATDIPSKELKYPVDVAHYLFTRLRQVGIQSIHGLPGTYPFQIDLKLDSANILPLQVTTT